mmetsp:Transcript_11352/g.25616  ORF Transcript_11352/g.25616 Transcript_11352/m.25616 type:complete len:212 (-) Transcript_11352:328-963(-)
MCSLVIIVHSGGRLRRRRRRGACGRRVRWRLQHTILQKVNDVLVSQLQRECSLLDDSFPEHRVEVGVTAAVCDKQVVGKAVKHVLPRRLLLVMMMLLLLLLLLTLLLLGMLLSLLRLLMRFLERSDESAEFVNVDGNLREVVVRRTTFVTRHGCGCASSGQVLRRRVVVVCKASKACSTARRASASVGHGFVVVAVVDRHRPPGQRRGDGW